MSSITDFVMFNIARFNRMRRKPPIEILTFIMKRTRQATVHLRDRIRMTIGEIRLSDDQFFDKLSYRNPALEAVKKALVQGNLKKARTEIANHMLIRGTPRFFFDRREIGNIQATLKEEFPYSKEITINLADEFARHRFHSLGVNVDFDGKIDWHSSIVSCRRWSLSFSPNIDYHSTRRVGDIKVAWEINRHQHFVILGKAYLYTGDEKYAAEFSNQLLSWIDENPYKIGINWMEGIEVALRLISWIWAYYFFMDSKDFKEKGHFRFLKSVYQQTKFVEEHLSDKWRINNNHLIAEASALALVGIMFPEFNEADRWKRKGIEILERELNTQILRDGATWEQSTGYHRFVTDLCLLVVILMIKNGIEIPKTVLSKVTQMISFLNAITNTQGRIPLIGDEDQGRAIRIDETPYDDARSTVTVGSILLNREDWLLNKSESAFWLLGEKALIKKSKSVVPKSELYEDSGFTVMRDKDKYMLFFVGPQDPRYLHSSHRHLDLLSIVLDAYGTCFITDPGTYTYLGDIKWRRYFKSMKAHNTIVVDNEDPTKIEEAFELSHIPIVSIRDYATADGFDWIAARHTGYKSTSHTRGIFFAKPEYWIITDLLNGVGEHVYDLYYHFDRDLDLSFDKSTQSVTAKSLTGNLKISPLKTEGLDAEILEGEVSPTYGVKVHAPVLRYRKRGKPPITLATVLYPYKNNEPKIKVSQMNVYGKDDKVLEENTAIGIKIDFGKHADYFVCSQTGEQHLHFERFEPWNGKIVYLRKKRGKFVKKIVL